MRQIYWIIINLPQITPTFFFFCRRASDMSFLINVCLYTGLTLLRSRCYWEQFSDTLWFTYLVVFPYLNDIRSSAATNYKALHWHFPATQYQLNRWQLFFVSRSADWMELVKMVLLNCELTAQKSYVKYLKTSIDTAVSCHKGSLIAALCFQQDKWHSLHIPVESFSLAYPDKLHCIQAFMYVSFYFTVLCVSWNPSSVWRLKIITGRLV